MVEGLASAQVMVEELASAQVMVEELVVEILHRLVSLAFRLLVLWKNTDKICLQFLIALRTIYEWDSHFSWLI